MSLFTSIPPMARLVIYVVYGVGSVVVTFLAATGRVGPETVAGWVGLGAVFGITASSNVDLNKPADPIRRRRRRPHRVVR